jgi:hypothetical protein
VCHHLVSHWITDHNKEEGLNYWNCPHDYFYLQFQLVGNQQRIYIYHILSYIIIYHISQQDHIQRKNSLHQYVKRRARSRKWIWG